MVVTHPLDIGFESVQTVCFNALGQPPTKTTQDPRLGVLQGFPVHRESEPGKITKGSPFRYRPEDDGLFDLHDLDMIQISGLAFDGPSHRIDLTFLDNPGLCATDDASGEPAGHCASLEDEAGSQERARGGD